jgi:methyl-accepting chemotaxis protein
MSGRETFDRARGGTPASILQRIFGRRRNYLLDTSYQVRSAIVAVLGMGFLLIFAAALFHLLTLERARLLARKAPLLARAASGSDVRSVLYLVAVGIVFVVAVFLIEIFETHKTAGVIFKVTRALKEIEGGRWGARVVLRRHDNFKEMEEAFNSAARALRDHLEQDLHGLQGIEGQVRLIAREFESGNREGALVLLRQIAAELQNLRERKRNLLT